MCNENFHEAPLSTGTCVRQDYKSVEKIGFNARYIKLINTGIKIRRNEVLATLSRLACYINARCCYCLVVVKTDHATGLSRCGE